MLVLTGTKKCTVNNNTLARCQDKPKRARNLLFGTNNLRVVQVDSSQKAKPPPPPIQVVRKI